MGACDLNSRLAVCKPLTCINSNFVNERVAPCRCMFLPFTAQSSAITATHEVIYTFSLWEWCGDVIQNLLAIFLASIPMAKNSLHARLTNCMHVYLHGNGMHEDVCSMYCHNCNCHYKAIYAILFRVIPTLYALSLVSVYRFSIGRNCDTSSITASL